MSLAARIKVKFDKHGESYMANGTVPGKGFFKILDSGTMRSYFDDIEISTFLKPALLLIVSSDAVLNVNDSIQRDGVTYKVRKIIKERFKGEVIFKLAPLTVNA